MAREAITPSAYSQSPYQPLYTPLASGGYRVNPPTMITNDPERGLVLVPQSLVPIGMPPPMYPIEAGEVPAGAQYIPYNEVLLMYNVSAEWAGYQVGHLTEAAMAAPSAPVSLVLEPWEYWWIPTGMAPPPGTVYVPSGGMGPTNWPNPEDEARKYAAFLKKYPQYKLAPNVIAAMQPTISQPYPSTGGPVYTADYAAQVAAAAQEIPHPYLVTVPQTDIGALIAALIAAFGLLI